MQNRQNFINKRQEIFTEVGSYDFDELSYIKEHDAQNVSVEMDALSCLQFFPHIQHLILRPGQIQANGLDYLRDLPIVSLKLDYYANEESEYTIDVTQFPKLQYIFSRTQYNFRNADQCKSLRTLIVQEWYQEDLRWLRGSNLYALEIFGGKLRSLNGICELPNLVSLSLSYLRTLQDIDHLRGCKKIESLSIANCARVDVCNIPGLPELRYLKLISRQKVDDFSFLRHYPNLEYLITDLRATDGNLDPLLRLSHSVILTDHRHYSHKNKDLPKSKHKFKSEIIPDWLRVLPEN